jgi:hypothetical protein
MTPNQAYEKCAQPATTKLSTITLTADFNKEVEQYQARYQACGLGKISKATTLLFFAACGLERGLHILRGIRHGVDPSAKPYEWKAYDDLTAPCANPTQTQGPKISSAFAEALTQAQEALSIPTKPEALLFFVACGTPVWRGLSTKMELYIRATPEALPC